MVANYVASFLVAILVGMRSGCDDSVHDTRLEIVVQLEKQVVKYFDEIVPLSFAVDAIPAELDNSKHNIKNVFVVVRQFVGLLSVMLVLEHLSED